MTPDLPNHPIDPSPLPPAEPRDRPGTRPALDIDLVINQVRSIQTNLALERAAKDAGKKKKEQTS
jgi:hypothetical protein